MDYIKAFFIGGAICVIGQLLMDHTKMLPGRVMVSFVVAGVILGAIGLYEPFAKWAGCGATVPLCGFGFRLWDGVKTAVAQKGFLGLFAGGMKSSAVGITGALIFGQICAIISNPKMKK